MPEVSAAVQAAFEAMEADIMGFVRRQHDHSPTNERMAQVAVDAARPIIEKELADRLVREIRYDPLCVCGHGLYEHQPPDGMAEGYCTRCAECEEFVRVRASGRG